MGEEEAAPKTIWEVLERTGVLGAHCRSFANRLSLHPGSFSDFPWELAVSL